MMSEKPIVTKTEIRQGLRGLGVERSGLLLAHSSLRSFGHVDGGADAVVDAMLEAVGPQGTVLVPTLTFQLLKQDAMQFDVRHSPSTSGLVTETFRNRSEACRSLHPISSAAAIGPQAEYLTADHADTPCDAASPYYRLAELGGKVVFFGASLGSNTLFHCAEDIVRPGYLGYASVDAEVIREDGTTVRVSARRYDCADRGVRRHLVNMESVLLEEGLLRREMIGNSRTYVIGGKENIESCVRVLRERPEHVLGEPSTGSQNPGVRSQ